MEEGNMTVKIVHKKSGKAYYVDKVCRITVTRLDSKTNPQETYRLKRRHYDVSTDENITDFQMFHSDEYCIGEIYDEEEFAYGVK